MTSQARLPLGLLLGMAAGVAFAACTTSGAPLGGPHGGNGVPVGPSVTNYSTVDAAYTVRPPDAAPGLQTDALPGTWTHIYYTYLVKGTVGNCSNGGSCHAQDMPNPSAAYQYLQDEGYVGLDMGRAPALTEDGSCLTWYGGDMPLGTVPAAEAAKAKAEMDQWAMMGGQDN